MHIKKGYFKPKNPSKFIGDPTSIFFRSGYELRMMKYLDENTNVIRWASDGLDEQNRPTKNSKVIIPYVSPIDNKVHRYFVDFYAEVRTKEGKIKTFLLEVKPKKQTQPPKQPKKRNTKRYITEVMTWGVNESKWKSATEFCNSRGWEFKIIHEDHLFGNKTK